MAKLFQSMTLNITSVGALTTQSHRLLLNTLRVATLLSQHEIEPSGQRLDSLSNYSVEVTIGIGKDV